MVTGGLAKYVIPLCRHPLTYDPELLLKGLALLYQLNAPQHERHHEPRSDGEHRRPRPAGRRPYNNGAAPAAAATITAVPAGTMRPKRAEP